MMQICTQRIWEVENWRSMHVYILEMINTTAKEHPTWGSVGTFPFVEAPGVGMGANPMAKPGFIFKTI